MKSPSRREHFGLRFGFVPAWADFLGCVRLSQSARQTAVSSDGITCDGNHMICCPTEVLMPAPAPYGLAIIDSCLTCHLREDRIFCNLPPTTLKVFDSLKQ